MTELEEIQLKIATRRHACVKPLPPTSRSLPLTSVACGSDLRFKRRSYLRTRRNVSFCLVSRVAISDNLR